MSKEDDQVVEFTNERLEALRQDIENLKQDPKFEQLSKAFRKTLAQRMGTGKLGDARTEIRGVLPIPLKQLVSKVDLSKPENAEKLSSISVSLESVLRGAGIRDVKDLVGRSVLQVDLNEFLVEIDPDELVFDPDSFYANIYSYRFW